MFGQSSYHVEPKTIDFFPITADSKATEPVIVAEKMELISNLKLFSL